MMRIILPLLLPIFCHCVAEYHFSIELRFVDLRNPARGELQPDRPSGSPLLTNGLSQEYTFLRGMYLVNNTFPGPLIQASEDEQFVISLHNGLENEFTDLHWHGLTQWDTYYHDGAYSMNTCGIAPEQTRTYNFKAHPCGTRFYHGHSAYQFAGGLAGPIIVSCRDDPWASRYTEEKMISVYDSWLHSAENVEMYNPFAISNPRFLLINGVYGDGSSALPYPEVQVRANQCYRLRVFSFIGLGWQFLMTINGHIFDVIAMNGHDLQNSKSGLSSVILTAAERLDLIFCANAAVGRYQIDVARYDTIPAMTATAILSYEGSSSALVSAAAIGGTYNTYVEIGQAIPYRTSASETLLPTSSLSFEMGSDFPENSATYFRQRGHLPNYWGKTIMVSGHPWENKGPPLVARCNFNLATQADPIYTFHEVTVVDFLFRNLFGISHSIHLHGHDVYIVARGLFTDPATGLTSVVAPSHLAASSWSIASLGNMSQEQYCTSTGVLNHSNVMPELFNLKQQVFETHGVITSLLCEQWSCNTDIARYQNTPLDTSRSFPTDVVWIQPRGWIVARAKLNNPGIWPFHCHQQLHVLNGMMTALDVLPNQQAKVPKHLLRNCQCSDDSDDDAVVWVSVVIASIIFVLFSASVIALKQARGHAATLEVKLKRMEILSTSSNAVPFKQQPMNYSYQQHLGPQQLDYANGRPPYNPQNLGGWKL